MQTDCCLFVVIVDNMLYQEHTCCQIDDMKQHVFSLHHIHRYMSETNIVLHEVGHRNHRLDHLMH